MANRQYRRNRRGQFASKGDSGTTVTIGRAGGFANAGLRARKANNAAAKRRRRALAAGAVRVAVPLGAAAVMNRRRKSIRNKNRRIRAQQSLRSLNRILDTIDGK